MKDIENEEFLTTEDIVKNVKNIDIKNMIVSTLLGLIPLVLGFALWKYLPDPCPVHYNIHGEIDRYEHITVFYLIGQPLLYCIVNILLYIISAADKKKKSKKYIVMISYLLAALCITTQGSMILLPLGFKFMNSIVMIAVSFFYIIIGNFLPKIPLNKGGEEIFKTKNASILWKHLSGKIYVITGFMVLITAFLPNSIKWIIFIAVLIIGNIIPFVFVIKANKNSELKGKYDD